MASSGNERTTRSLHGMRAVTLMELSDLPDFIKRGKQVLLLVGPCGQCGGPKEEVLESVLTHKRKLITHLVVDSRSARGLFEQDQLVSEV